MPRKKKIKTNIIEEAPSVPIEEQGLDELIDLDNLILKKDAEKLTPWEKLKIVLKLRDRLTFTDIAELLKMKSISVKRMGTLSRHALELRGIDPDKFYSLIEQGVSYWTMIPYLTDNRFVELVNSAKDANDFTVKFKDYKSKGIPKRTTTKFTLSLSDFLNLFLLDNYRILLERNRANLTLNETFMIKLKPVYGMFYVDDDNRVVLTIWENEDEEPYYIGGGES